MMKAVVFTGHRFISAAAQTEAKIKLKDRIMDAYSRGVRVFVTGMAMGFDLIAASVVVGLQREHEDLQLIAVVPFRGQSERFNPYFKSLYEHILVKASRTIVLSERYYERCLLKRNDYMLDFASEIIAYYDGKPKGGTFYTIRNAMLRGIRVTNIYPNN